MVEVMPADKIVHATPARFISCITLSIFSGQTWLWASMIGITASDITAGLGVGVGVGIGVGVVGGTVGVGVTDGAAGVGGVGTGDGVVDGFRLQPNSTASIRTDMTRKFHFIPASQHRVVFVQTLTTKQGYYALRCH